MSKRTESGLTAWKGVLNIKQWNSRKDLSKHKPQQFLSNPHFLLQVLSWSLLSLEL